MTSSCILSEWVKQRDCEGEATGCSDLSSINPAQHYGKTSQEKTDFTSYTHILF